MRKRWEPGSGATRFRSKVSVPPNGMSRVDHCPARDAPPTVVYGGAIGPSFVAPATLRLRLMTNPALELAGLLETWQVPGANKSVAGSRMGHGRNLYTLDTVKRQIHASRLLGEVLQELEKLGQVENITSWELFVPKWWDAVTLPQRNWLAAEEGEFYPKETIATLENFGRYLERMERPIHVTQEALVGSRSAVDELLSLLNSDELRLDAEARAYVFALVSEVRTMLDSSTAGISLKVLARIHQLIGFLTALANDIETDESKSPLVARLRKLARKVMPVAGPAARAAGWALEAASNAQSLTMGEG